MSPARLGLGTAPFMAGYSWGDDPHATDPAPLLEACLDGGIHYVDTSGHYGDIEMLLGRLRPKLQRHAARLCVKVAMFDWPHGVDEALERLGESTVDTVMVHSANARFLREPQLADAMHGITTRRRAARTGASTYGVDDASYVLAQPWGDAVQVEHSLLNPSVVRAVGPHLRSGQEIVVRSVLCRGLLTARWRDVPAPGDATIAPTIERLAALAAAWGFADLAELAIRFALDTPQVGIVLVGLASIAELHTALAAAGHAPLTAAQLDALGEFDLSSADWTHLERWPVPA